MAWRRKARWLLALAALVSVATPGQDRIAACAGCHGADGNSVDPSVPSIAGQPSIFLQHQLFLFREGVRKSEAMGAAVKGLQDGEIALLAERVSQLPVNVMERAATDPKLIEVGLERAKALRCAVCHLSDFSGQNQIPRLAGQREAYLEAEMRAYRDGKRTGGDTIMAAALYGVSDADIKALAHYLSRSTSRSPAR